MRLLRIRFSVRRMMLAVVIVAVVIDAVRLSSHRMVFIEAGHQSSRRMVFRTLAESNAKLEAGYLRTANTTSVEGLAEYCRWRAARHSLLRAKYEHAARHPWLHVAPDPSEPE